MRKRAGRIVGASLTILGTVAASSAIIGGPAYAEPSTATAEISDAGTNSSLDALAKLFAGAVTDKGFRQTIQDSVAERFDGDNDVLWKSLKAKPGAQDALTKVASQAKGISTLSAQNTVAALANGIPRFQVAVPANLGTWNAADYTPLVAWMPEGVDDTTLATITAYDAAGKAHQLDAQVAPKQPVIVLGVNERTDDAGNVLQSRQSDVTSADESVSAAAASYKVTMNEVVLLDDKEPWAKGDAEIAVRVKSRGCSGTGFVEYNWAGLNNTGDEWTGVEDLGSTKCDVVFSWWEDDGSSFDFELAYGDYKLGIGMDDDDDRIGDVQIKHSLFEGSSQNRTNWGSLRQWTS
jgi:hypothetical protein